MADELKSDVDIFCEKLDELLIAEAEYDGLETLIFHLRLQRNEICSTLVEFLLLWKKANLSTFAFSCLATQSLEVWVDAINEAEAIELVKGEQFGNNNECRNSWIDDIKPAPHREQEEADPWWTVESTPEATGDT